MHDPASLCDMDSAVERIVQAIRQREKIVVFGDYDVDGVSSTAVMLDFLDAVGADGAYILPDRHVDGYGLKPPGVERAIGLGPSLFARINSSAMSGFSRRPATFILGPIWKPTPVVLTGFSA